MITWHIHAPGTSAPSNTSKHGHTGVTDCGNFHVSPLFSSRGRFQGYLAQFTTNGRIQQPGLWRTLGQFYTLADAKRACKRYYAKAERNTYDFLTA